MLAPSPKQNTPTPQLGHDSDLKSLPSLPLPQPDSNTLKSLRYGHLSGCSASLLISQITQQYAHRYKAPTVLLVPDRATAEHYLQALSLFKGPTHFETKLLPDWETLPYDYLSPHPSITSKRLKLLHRLPMLTKGLLVVPLSVAMQKLAPQSYISKHSFVVACKEPCDRDSLRQHLTHYGYSHVTQVTHPGELSMRGSIIDIFPIGSEYPWRIDLFDDEIDSIRAFDPETQRSLSDNKHTKKVSSIEILPAHEYPLDQEGIARFRQAWQETFTGNPSDCPLYQGLSQGEQTAGFEYYLPLFFEKTDTLFDYLPKNTLLLLSGDLHQAATEYWDIINTRYEQYRHDTTRPLLPPKALFLTLPDLMSQIKVCPHVHLQNQATKTGDIKKGEIDYPAQALPPITINHKDTPPLKALKAFLDHQTTACHSDDQTTRARVLFCAETRGRREALLEQLKTIEVYPQPVETWQAFLNSTLPQAIIVSPIEEGAILTDLNITIISEFQLIDTSVIQKRKRRLSNRSEDITQLIYSLAELSIGDPVVHIQYGIGRYLGLEMIVTQGQAAEYLKLSYAEETKLYVPVTSLHLISRYSGLDPSQVQLSHLGTKKWQKAKEKAAARARDTAAELLAIYAQRAEREGFSFTPPDKEYQRFEKAFPFELTIDQARAIKEVIQDMTTPKSMDRLICGDVGFGKTEVAMRAAFLCIQSHKQVMVMVPTTLLATQHGERFKDRFAQWPIKIEVLSRLQSPKTQQHLLHDLKNGKIDIIIGTHKLLQKNIVLKDLGLLIVDEEHRFGVRQKEHIKSKRAHVDILTLTATPIPRTLNLSLASLRDISIIATPPQERLSIKTFVSQYNNTLVREAITREILRGGQVYFLHNSVKTISAKAQELSVLVPEARIKIAHGQMPPHEMEHVMNDFYHQRSNVLVCTTLIESGIDIPTANTIIIENANQFGLAQLHQIRGRVGRSHHQAYAYFMIRSQSSLTQDAIKRLEAIASLDELGAGFMLARHDLEIRGAGELLGDEQSGHIATIGFDLYTKMLNAAVKSIREETNSGSSPDTSLEDALTTLTLNAPTLIPDTYIADVHTRLVLYKRIAQAQNEEDLNQLQVEMIDRFGLLPEPAKNMMKFTQIKLKATQKGVKEIKIKSKEGEIEFHKTVAIDVNKVIHLIQKHPNQYKLIDSHKIRFNISTPSPDNNNTPPPNIDQQIDAITQLLNQILS